MIRYLFLDLDDTILDFHRAERVAICKTFREHGLEPTEEVLQRYHDINIAHWKMLERQEITREQVLLGRFHTLFSVMGQSVDAAAVAHTYEQNLGIGHYFLPGAREAVERLSKNYPLYLASNGTASVQHSRLTSAGLYPYFQQVFISQNMGCNKPAPEFFSACFARIPGFRPEEALMVGDSLSSDILGGSRAGMQTCWVNPTNAPLSGDIHPDHQIPSLSQLEALLGTLEA